MPLWLHVLILFGAIIGYSDSQRCDLGWQLHNGYCYKSIAEKECMSAEHVCRKNKTEMVSVHSAADNSFVVDLHRQTTNKFPMCIGLRRYDGAWLYMDGSKQDFSAWYPGYPQAQTIGCVAVDEKGSWWDAWCHLIKGGTVCKKKASR